jgi:hypothetical protein
MKSGWDAHIVFPQEVGRLLFVVAPTTVIAGSRTGSAEARARLAVGRPQDVLLSIEMGV